VGFFAGFAVPWGSDRAEIVRNILTAMFGFFITLPAALAAIWKPKVSACVLVLSFAAFECLFATSADLGDILAAGVKLGLPTLALSGGYLYIAKCIKRAS
jgi:hypothetical protein